MRSIQADARLRVYRQICDEKSSKISRIRLPGFYSGIASNASQTVSLIIRFQTRASLFPSPFSRMTTSTENYRTVVLKNRVEIGPTVRKR